MLNTPCQITLSKQKMENHHPHHLGEVCIKDGRYNNRKRLQIQRPRSFMDRVHDEVVDDVELKKNKDNKHAAHQSLESSSSSVLFPRTAPIEMTVAENKEMTLRNYPDVAYGSVSMCGRRRAMEDAVTISPGLLVLSDLAVFDFFAVYDGHGGSDVAYMCRDRLHRVLVKEVESLEGIVRGDDGFDWKKVMECCFMKMDGEVDERGFEVEDIKSIGSTALVALVGKEKVVVANCGDSRAVLSRRGSVIALSHDHKPDRPDELERVEAAGGRVINWNGFRVLGVLATSRSIGDHYLKPYVISEPEVIVMDRTADDEFIILASDGLWDVISNEVACDVVRRCFKGHIGRRRTSSSIVGETGAAQAAAILAALAMAKGSKDNISVVVIELNKLNSKLL